MFKVGDWVRVKSEVDGEYIERYDEVSKHYSCELELWKPKEGEWYWLDRVLCKITFINEYGPDEFYFIDSVNQTERKGFFSISKIEPFIGELPSFIKD